MTEQWETLYEDHVIRLKRNKLTGVYVLFDGNTGTWLVLTRVLPKNESDVIRRWETLYEDDFIRLKHNKGIEDLYELINKRTGVLELTIARGGAEE